MLGHGGGSGGDSPIKLIDKVDGFVCSAALPFISPAAVWPRPWPRPSRLLWADCLLGHAYIPAHSFHWLFRCLTTPLSGTPRLWPRRTRAPPLPAGAAVVRQSAMAAPGLSKAEYLRRYLSGPAEPAQPRRRRKKKPPGGTGRAG